MNSLHPWLSEPELWLTAIVSLIALVAVLIPFARGLALSLGARRLTRRVAQDELAHRLAANAVPDEPITLAAVRVLEESLETESEAQPLPFLRDATKQYMLNEYDTSFAQPVSMFANLLPPIGFIGTTVGLAFLLASMHLANESLQLGALAVALSSTIFALVAFAILETLKVGLYRRVVRCLDDAMGYAPGAPSEGDRIAG
jgi:hypothetical protein